MAEEKLKTYQVSIDLKWSLDCEVKAKNKTEAKQKAFNKIKKSDFEFKCNEDNK